MKLLTSSITLFAITLSSQGNIKDSLYVDLYGGSSFLESSDIIQRSMVSNADFDSGAMFGGRVGYQHNVNWAFELEYTYQRNDLGTISGGNFSSASEGDYASTAIMFNAVYTFDSFKKDFSGITWKPYAGIGVGFLTEADIDFTISGTETEYDDNFLPAAQLIIGSEFKFNKNWSIFGEVRYTFAGNIDLKSSSGADDISIDYSGPSAMIGLRYRF